MGVKHGIGGFDVGFRPLVQDRSKVLDSIAPVTQRHDTLIVLASGPSGAGPWPEHPGVPVIAVNGAIDGLVWDPDYWITLDPSPINQGRFQSRRQGTRYFVAVNSDHGPNAKDLNHRADFTGCHKLLRQHGRGLPGDKRIIHIGNSGRAGIQLALHMGAKRVAVFGVDATDEGYWHADGMGPDNLKGLPGLLCELAGLADIRFADSPRSRVAGFPKVPPADLLRWICN